MAHQFKLAGPLNIAPVTAQPANVFIIAQRGAPIDLAYQSARHRGEGKEWSDDEVSNDRQSVIDPPC